MLFRTIDFAALYSGMNLKLGNLFQEFAMTFFYPTVLTEDILADLLLFLPRRVQARLECVSRQFHHVIGHRQVKHCISQLVTSRTSYINKPNTYRFLFTNNWDDEFCEQFAPLDYLQTILSNGVVPGFVRILSLQLTYSILNEQALDLLRQMKSAFKDCYLCFLFRELDFDSCHALNNYLLTTLLPVFNTCARFSISGFHCKRLKAASIFQVLAGINDIGLCLDDAFTLDELMVSPKEIVDWLYAPVDSASQLSSACWEWNDLKKKNNQSPQIRRRTLKSKRLLISTFGTMGGHVHIKAILDGIRQKILSSTPKELGDFIFSFPVHSYYQEDQLQDYLVRRENKVLSLCADIHTIQLKVMEKSE